MNILNVFVLALICTSIIISAFPFLDERTINRFVTDKICGNCKISSNIDYIKDTWWLLYIVTSLLYLIVMVGNSIRVIDYNLVLKRKIRKLYLKYIYVRWIIYIYHKTPFEYFVNAWLSYFMLEANYHHYITNAFR